MRSSILRAVLVLSGIGCSDAGVSEGGTNTEPPAGTPDASSDMQVSIEVASKLRVIQGSPSRMPVKLTRAGTPGPVELSVSGLPAGVTSRVVTAAADQTEVDIVIEASSDSVQGTPADAVVTAKTSGHTATATIKLRITGAPGTPDLSFGNGGVVSVQPPGIEQPSSATVRALAVTETGQAIVVYDWSTVVKFDAKGALDVGFGISGRIASGPVVGCPDHRPCLFIQPDSKILLLNQERGAGRFWADGGVDLSFGTDGAIWWGDSNNTVIWAASPAVVEGQGYLLTAGARGGDNKPFVERIGGAGARDARFDATAGLACEPQNCLYPLALGARADGSVLYASYPGISGTGKVDVRLTELSNTGTARFTSPVLFAASGNWWAETRVFILPDVGGSTVVFGLDAARKLTVAKVSPTGAPEAVRALGIESPSFPECDTFGVVPTGSERLMAFCTVDETREVRLLRLTHALAPDESFAPGGLVVGNTNGAGARIALGPEDTIIVAAERKLTRLWN